MEYDEPLIQILLQGLPIGEIPTEGEDDMRRRSEILSQVAAPDLTTAFVGAGLRGEFHGLDGYREGWRDWLEPFARCEIELEEVREWDDGLVVLTKQTLTPKGTDAEMEGDAAAVLVFKDEKLAVLEFHLDRGEAMRVAGLAG